MAKRLARKRAWKDESGVSEVVGSILILVMTVVLFSGIIVWVWGLPTPEALSKIDISSEFDAVDYDGDEPPTWDICYINLTHKGGEELKSIDIELYLRVNNSIEVLYLKTQAISPGGGLYGLTGGDEDWSIGETWWYRNYSMEWYHRISITVVDRFANAILWQKTLYDPEGKHPPIFADKWVDGNPSSDSRDQVQDNMTDIYTGAHIPFGIFAKVGDLDNDLNKDSVYVNFTFGPLAGHKYKMVDNGNATLCDDYKNDSVFSVCKSEFWPASDWTLWDGGILLLNATDNAGHETTSRLTLRVYNYGDRLNLYHNTTQQTGNLTWGKPAEYAIFDEVEWVAYGQGYVITNNDTKGSLYYNRSVYVFNSTDKVHVKVLSNILDNAYKRNVFRLYDATTGAVLTPPSNKIFTHVGVVASYHKFVLNFSANSIQNYNPSTGGCYKVYIELRDTDDDYFIANTWFNVKKSGGGNPSCPKVTLYRDAAFTQKSTFFNSWDYMYVEVTPANSADSNVQLAVVEIQDFWGHSPVRNGPVGHVTSCFGGGVGPVTGMNFTNGNCAGGKYRFRIDLFKADHDAWLLGNATYTVYLKMFKDNNEYYESLSANVYIFSPASILDVASGWDDNGGGTNVDRFYGVFYENFGGYYTRSVYAWRAGLNGQNDYFDGWYSTEFADMNNDADADIVASYPYNGGSLTIFDNYDARGHFTKNVIASGKKYASVAVGDVNADDLYDIVAISDGGALDYYPNNGYWNVVKSVATGIGTGCSGLANGGHCLEIVNLDGDKFKEIVVGTSSGVRVYKNNTGTWDTWTAKFSDATANAASVGVGQLGYGGASNNGFKDFAVGYTNGYVKAFLNGISGASWSFTVAAVDSVGRNAAHVDVGNIYGGTWNNIVSGSGYTSGGKTYGKILIYSATNAAGTTWSHNIGTNYDDDVAQPTSPNGAGGLGQDTGIVTLRVGNIDGTLYDDIAIGMPNFIYTYRNLMGPSRPSDWKRFMVDDFLSWTGKSLKPCQSLDLGDMNMGNPLT